MARSEIGTWKGRSAHPQCPAPMATRHRHPSDPPVPSGPESHLPVAQNCARAGTAVHEPPPTHINKAHTSRPAVPGPAKRPCDRPRTARHNPFTPRHGTGCDKSSRGSMGCLQTPVSSEVKASSDRTDSNKATTSAGWRGRGRVAITWCRGMPRLASDPLQESTQRESGVALVPSALQA